MYFIFAACARLRHNVGPDASVTLLTAGQNPWKHVTWKHGRGHLERWFHSGRGLTLLELCLAQGETFLSHI